MKKIVSVLLTIALSCLVGYPAFTQNNLPSRLSYSVKVTFQTYGLPFKNLGNSFKNIGGAFSVDYAYNKSGNLQQSFILGYQSHIQHEAGYYLNTQFCY